MGPSKYINLLSKKLPAGEIGNKAQSLLFLKKYNFKIPETYVLSSLAHSSFLQKDSALEEKIIAEIKGIPDKSYAIRSSTNLEDTDSVSFAGQFQTLINISGAENIWAAVQKVWQSADGKVKKIYKQGLNGKIGEISCGVIIQEMVKSKLAGVSFSKNPVTHVEETIVEAVEGQGENLVQKGITPFRWRIKNNEIIEGNKDFAEIDIIKKVSDDTQILKKKYGKDVDIEWAYDGKDIYYLQLRSITGKKKMPVYSNKMAQEMLPGQIKPLVWSVNIPLVNGTWIKLLSEITGKLNIKPEDLSKSFYYRTYFNMAALGEIFHEFGMPADSLEAMMGRDKNKPKTKFKPGLKTLRHTFRIIRFLHSKLNFEKTFLKEYLVLMGKYKSLELRIKNNFTLESYNQLFNELFEGGGKIAYLNIIVPLLMQFYNKSFAGKLKKLNIEYDLLEFNEDFPALISMSPIPLMDKIKQHYDELPAGIKTECKSVSDLSGFSEASNVVEEFNSLLKHFGHLSESGNDFSVPKWEENPDLVFNMINHTSVPESKRKALLFRELKYSKFRNPFLKKQYLKAGKYKVYREQISSLYIYGYGLFRLLFLKVGDEFIIKGLIEARDDIFYLSRQEIDELIDSEGCQTKDYKFMIHSRKKEMEDSKDLLLPSVIIGDEAPILESGKIKNYVGVGTSPGVYKGRTCIVKGISDFKLVNKGDVVIIPFSDVSWTPILIGAGAIVSEAGGMLSHCSIVARELGIPSVVSVENACSIKSGLAVTVDGSNGILTIHDDE